jgi:glycosyltransferase involved in cell wall biosynthesis
LRGEPGVATWEKRGRVAFTGRLPRIRVWEEMRTADVGLSLIPPEPAYRESSPTKLAEYLATGLALVASTGIPYQEDVIRNAGCGLLVPWESEAIASAIVSLACDRALCDRYRIAGWDYAARHLNREAFLRVLRRILGLVVEADDRNEPSRSNET